MCYATDKIKYFKQRMYGNIHGSRRVRVRESYSMSILHFPLGIDQPKKVSGDFASAQLGLTAIVKVLHESLMLVWYPEAQTFCRISS